MVGEVVAGSPAEEAGLNVGDIIVAVDDTEITSARELIETIQSYSPGDTVTITVESDGETSDVTVTLAERPENLETPSEPEFVPQPQMRGMLNFLGLEAEVSDEGLLINSIAADSPLADSDLQEGDLITEINGEPITGLDPGALMRGLMAEDTLTLTVERGGEEIEVELDLSALAEGFEVMPMQPGMGPGMMMGQPTQLGVRFATLTPEVAEEEGVDVQEGALIIEVFEGTPAAEAGLLADDIITAVDGDVVDEERTLADRLFAYEEGDVVTLTVLRGGEEMEISVTLGPSPYGRGGMFGFGPGGRFHFGPGMEGFEDFFNMPPFSSPDDVPAPETPSGDESSA
jgi:S1-C subfamily serine protease